MRSTNRRSVLRLPALTLALALMFALLLALAPSHTYAATTTVISDQASCEAFGARWDVDFNTCEVDQDITIAPGDSLIFQVHSGLSTVTNNGTLTNATGYFIATGSITNNASATINAGDGGFRTYGASVNYGTINGHFEISRPFTNASTGQMNIQGELFLADVLTNQGTITLACGSTISAIYDGQITGTPAQYADCTGPTVTVNQAVGQSDPTSIRPINFTAIFNENVTGFTTSDVALSGTAGATSAVVTGSGSTYTIAVSGMTGDGTVIVSIPADAAQDTAGNPSAASTSTDNSVSFTRTTVISDQASCEAFGGEWHTNPSTCLLFQVGTIPAGDTLILQVRASLSTVTNNGTLTNATGQFIPMGSITNNAGATINAGADGISINGPSVNYGTINGMLQIISPFTNASTGQMNIQGQLLLMRVLTNQGTITIACDSDIKISGGQIVGTPPQNADCTGPKVTINQAAGQSDPTSSGPINFTTVFGENVTGFTASDVALSGTAGATSAVVTGSGSTYTITVSGMTGYGTVIVSIPAGAVQDAAGNPSTPSTSTDNSVSYLPSSTSTSFTTSVNPARLGEPITFRVTVIATSGATPNGTVTFLSGTTALGTATLVDGVASFTTSSLPVGNTVITARFEGTPAFNPSVSAAGTQVVRAGSSTTLTLSASTSNFGEPITLNATVSGGATSPSGSVTFYDGPTALGTKALRTGAASVTVSTLAAGTHTLTAVYGGTPQLDGSVSPALSHTVTPAQTTTGLTVAPGSSVLGQTITLTATVSVVAPGGGKPAGTVSFYDGTTLLGTKPVNTNGVAIYSASALAIGSHSLRAEYGGSANHSASASAPTVQVVAAAGTTTTLATSATNVVNGQKITLTATVAAVAPGKGTPSGSIVFRDGVTELGSVTLSNGRATKQVTLAVGSHNLVAEYVPADGSFSASSGTTSATVDPASTGITLTTSGTPATFGRKVTFTATVKVNTPGVGIPTGTVVFRDGDTVLAEVPLVNGKATFATTTLARGTHPITASYSGDAGNSASVSSTLTQQVN